MKTAYHKYIRAIAAVTIVFAMLLLLVFKPASNTPAYQSKVAAHQRQLMESAKAVVSSGSDTFLCGWAQVNLQPPFGTPIAIDAERGGKFFEGIRDSVFVKAFVFKKGNQKIAYVCLDLLIVPPQVFAAFDTALRNEGFTTQNIYFSATHTHTSIGAWHESMVGEIFAGKYDKRVPAHLVDCISRCLTQAEKNALPAQFGFASIPTSQLVENRLVHEKGTVDSVLHLLKLVQNNGNSAGIISFSAHCTIFHKQMMKLSGDWAGELCSTLTRHNICQFAAFSAGAVGSHGPFPKYKNAEKQLNYMVETATGLIADTFSKITIQPVEFLYHCKVPLILPEPNYKVNNLIAIRPWVFKKFFGTSQTFVNLLCLNQTIFAGVPCDFSGELTSSLYQTALTNGYKLCITSFNGGYIGYVTHQNWENMNSYETRTMNWFGPGMGTYLQHVLQQGIEKVSTDKKNIFTQP